ncbi:MAG: TPM domain-containing protein [Rhizobiaceae bacterium]|nr:TPM domain-containing protein [Rhizobiaceae bacterium]
MSNARGPILSTADHGRISQAIRKAEERTSGEIVCVLARSSDDYFFPAAFFLLLGAMAASLLAGLWIDQTWHTLQFWQFVATQIVAAASLMLVIWWWPGLRIHLVPRRLRYLRAHRAAVAQFLATNIHATRDRTGVLIFVSLAEHYAEVLADAGINARVPQEQWNAIVAHLVSHAAKGEIAGGFEHAVAEAGALLAAQFPRGSDDHNELEDRLVEI